MIIPGALFDLAFIAGFVVFAVIAILVLVIASLAALPIIAGLAIVLCILIGAAFLFIMQSPKRIHDHYAKAFGDYPNPKVTHGR